MRNAAQKFAELLSSGMYAIQRVESERSKKPLKAIQEELGNALERKGATIEWYRKGNLPTTTRELELLVRTVFFRGRLGVDWLEQILRSARHPNWAAYRDELLLSNTEPTGTRDRFSYKRTKFFCLKRVLPDGSSDTLHQVEIKVLSEAPLGEIRHRLTNLDNRIDGFQLSLEESHREDGGAISSRIIANRDHICVSAVEFHPPLQRGQLAWYAYRVVAGRIHSTTADEVEQQFRDGTRPTPYEYWAFRIVVPTDSLEMQLILPLKYDLALTPDGGFGAYFGGSRDEQETARIASSGGFVADYDRGLQRWRIDLRVSRPEVAYSYEMHWIPPRKRGTK